MKFLKLLFFSNCWIALIGGIFAYYLNHALNKDFPPILFSFIPLSIFIAYNIIRIWQVSEYENLEVTERHQFYVQNADTLKWICYCLMLIWAVHILFFPLHIQLSLIPVALLSILYKFPLKLKNLHVSLREIPYIKSIIVAISWSYFLYVFPSLFIQKIGLTQIAIFALLSLYFWAITIPFDIRDAVQDEQNHLHTYHAHFQSDGIIKLSSICLCIVLILTGILHFLLSLNWMFTCTFAVLQIASIFIIRSATKAKQSWWYDAYIDGSMLIAPTLYILVLFLFHF